jgi:predicted transcriptional regulator
MTEIELQELLEELYNETFLDSIKLIYEKEISYKKSDFFKATKIPLSTLYEKYFIYMNSKYSIEDKLNDFITKIDTDKLTDISLDWIEKLEDNDKFNKIINIILEKFDLSKLQEGQKEIESIISDIKQK